MWRRGGGEVFRGAQCKWKDAFRNCNSGGWMKPKMRAQTYSLFKVRICLQYLWRKSVIIQGQRIGRGQYSFRGSRNFDTSEEDIYSRKPERVDVGLSKNDPKPPGKLGKVIRDNPQQSETHPKVFLKRTVKMCCCFYLFICSIINNSMLISESGMCCSEVGLMEEFCQHHTKRVWELILWYCVFCIIP